jgi:hypothetical protein
MTRLGRLKRSGFGVTVVLMVVLAACAGQAQSTEPQGTASGSQPASTPTTAPATASPSMASCPNPDGGTANKCLGILPAGTYSTQVFDPQITYTVNEGWGNYEDLPGNFLLVPPGQSLDGVNADTSDFIGIYSGVAAAAASCDEAPEPTAGRTAEGMAGWYTSDPGLDATSEPASIGGLDGFVVDIALDPAWTGSCPFAHAGEPLVPILVGTGPAGLHHVLNASFSMRLYLLDYRERVVGIEVVDHPGSLGMDDYAPVVEALQLAH